jgi:hypothetical protein
MSKAETIDNLEYQCRRGSCVKNDFIDAEAIAEAVTKQNMRFVPIKTEE